MPSIKCPIDLNEIREVKAKSHYGWPVILEQCQGCGGLWFDRYELFSLRTAQAEKIETLDARALVCPSRVLSARLLCPRDGTELARFTGANFPEQVVVAVA